MDHSVEGKIQNVVVYWYFVPRQNLLQMTA
jgi:hypothetical protein